LEWVALADIDDKNLAFLITTPQDKPSLERSIRRVGLISPIIVRPTGDHALAVVSGFRRIQACRRLGWQKLPCRILPSHASTARCAEIAIADNLTQRPFNTIEQARCLQILSDDRIEAADARQISEAFGIATNRSLRMKLNRVLMAPQPVQDALVLGIISLPVVLQLAELDTADAKRIVGFFVKLPMGLNRQREMLLLLKEITVREDLTLKALLSEDGIRKILDDEAADGNLKARQVRDYLRKRRYPRLTAVERAFGRCVRELRIDRSIQISPPPGFEGRTCTATIRFDSQDDLLRASRELSEIAEQGALARLFDTI
jgi:ParB family chromosome partitioning protein